MKNSSQGLKLAEYISKIFAISNDKAYAFIKKAPLTIFDKIDDKKLIEVEKKLKELDADYEILELEKREVEGKALPNKIEPDISHSKNDKNNNSSTENTLLYIIVFLIGFLFLSSIGIFTYFYVQKTHNSKKEKQLVQKQKENIKQRKEKNKSPSFSSKIKSFLATDYKDDDIMKLIFEGKFELANSILSTKLKKEGENSKLYKYLGILYFSWAYSDRDKNKWKDYGTNLDDLWNNEYVKKSLKYFENSLSMNSDDYEVINYIGVIFYEKGWFDRSERMYHEAIIKNPTYIEAISNLGILYNSLGQLEKAEKIFEKILKLNNKNRDAILNLALVNNRLKKYNRAIFYLKRYINIRPADENYLPALQLLKKLDTKKGIKQ